MPLQDWDRVISSLPEPHILQTAEWAWVKSQFGWQMTPLVWYEEGGEISGYEFQEVGYMDGQQPLAAAILLSRSVPIFKSNKRFSILYAPKGPLLMDWGNQVLRGRVLQDIGRFAKQRGAIFVKIDPDVRLGVGDPEEQGSYQDPVGREVVAELNAYGWKLSADQIQFRNTVIIDLRPSEEELLAQMKQKTRYNVRLAKRKGVRVRRGSLVDLDELYRMYAETSLRDGFSIRERSYYMTAWEHFVEASMAEPLIAEVEGEAVAGLVIFVFGKKAWYLYGMSRDVHREKMPNYLLQWEAMRWAKAAGCEEYDLWGAPDVFNSADSMWNVYRFKKGLGGQVVRHIGAWDLHVRPFIFWMYSQIIPQLLALMRRSGKTRTLQELS